MFFLIFRKSTLNNITLIDNKFMQTHISAQTIDVAEDPFKTVLYLEYNVDVSVSSKKKKKKTWKRFKCIRTCVLCHFPCSNFLVYI